MFAIHDLRLAARRLARSPGFTILTVVVLAGGLGLSIFTFSFLYTAMMKPLPLANGDRIVRLFEETTRSSSTIDAVDAARLTSDSRTLSLVGAYTFRNAILGEVDKPLSLQVTLAEPNLFDLAHVAPMLGRRITPRDAVSGAEPALVLSYGTWNAVFGRDTAIVGTTVRLDGTPTRVVGVMPAGFGFPVASEGWMALADTTLSATARGTAAVSLYAQLADGVTRQAASAELSVILARSRFAVPLTPGAATGPAAISVQTFPMAQLGGDGPVLFAVLNTIAALILLLACINVMNLLLARANERARETSVRLALGASRLRLMLQGSWETVLLCVVGGVFGTGLAAWGLWKVNALAQASLEGNLAFWWSWQLHRTDVFVAAGFVTLAMTVIGGVVAARASNQKVAAVLNDGGARSGGRARDRFARGLVVVQIATVCVLMYLGLLASTIADRFVHVDFGYPTARLVRAAFDLPGDRYAHAAQRSQLYRVTLDALAGSPAIEGAFIQARLGEIAEPSGRFAEAQEASPLDGPGPHAFVAGVAGSMDVIGVRAVTGRAFDGRDDELGAPTALVSQSLAAKFWPGRSPLGEQIRLAVDTASRRIVGVVSDVWQGNPLSRDRSTDVVYVPLQQVGVSGVVLTYRHRGDPAAASAALYRALHAADPAIAVPTLTSYDEVAAKSAMLARFVVRLFSACFGFALLLAVSGAYGLMARAIGARTRELGVRRALGASDGRVSRLLLSDGTRQLGAGVLIATPLMLLVGAAVSRYFTVGITVAAGFAAVTAAAVMGVVLTASWVPARRALRVPLGRALRQE